MFAFLSPDEEVRESAFWSPKEGDKKDQIYKAERIAFALAKRVKDPARKATLTAEAVQMLEVYRSLNEAHSRDEVDESRCKDAIRAMKVFLESWVDSVV
ncbi:MAG: hypothetical protein IMZ62_16235 [Chloroflexi bacterium]|nr:hypothetical protein [Chloroflexota bacterium]